MQKINKCNLCGKRAKLISDEENHNHYVTCKNCKTRTMDFSIPERAIEAWNWICAKNLD